MSARRPETTARKPERTYERLGDALAADWMTWKATPTFQMSRSHSLLLTWESMRARVQRVTALRRLQHSGSLAEAEVTRPGFTLVELFFTVAGIALIALFLMMYAHATASDLLGRVESVMLSATVGKAVAVFLVFVVVSTVLGRNKD